MVHTRSQKTKEANDTKLAEQQSLVEQVQQVSVSKQPQHELKAATASSQDVSQQVTSQDISQVGIVKRNVSEPDLSKQIISKIDFVEPKASKTDLSERDASRQDIVQQDTVQQNVSARNIGQQDAVAEISMKLDAGQSISDSTIVEHPGNEHPGNEHPSDEHPGYGNMLSIASMQSIAKKGANESGSIETENEDSRSINNVTTILKDSIIVVREKKIPASPTSHTVSDTTDHILSTMISVTEHSRRYSLRSRARKIEKSVLTKVKEPLTTLTIIESPDTSVSNANDDGDVEIHESDIADKLTHLSAPNAKIEEHYSEFQPTTTRYAKKQVNSTSEKITTNKTGPQQNSAISKFTSNKVRSVADRPGKDVSENVEAGVSDGKRSMRARGRTISKGKQHGSSDKNTQGKKKSPKVSKTHGIRFDIPVNSKDEDEFVPEKTSTTTTQNVRSLRDRTKMSSYRKKALITARSRTTKSSKASSSKKTRAANVVKARQRDTQEKRFIVKLSLSKKLLGTVKIKKPKTKGPEKVKVPKGFFTNKYRFKFGWTPFAEYPKVHEQTYQDIYNLLAESLAPEGISLDRKSGDEIIINGVPQGPMHAGEAVTVDALVKVIMSQATNNENALSAQARLISAFPYFVDGETVTGKTPNYHDVRIDANKTKLQNALATAGLHIKRAVAIPGCLTAIRQKNIDANSPGCSIDSNPAGATDFVPGSLSLEYLNELTKEEKMDELLSLPLIGIKTAMCVLGFAFGLPVFAVDTHVHRMVKWLGWVPEACNPNDAAAHLDVFIPDRLKYGLHQGFWHHGQKCLRCQAKNDPKTKGWEEAVCVLEEFVKRHPKKERKSPERKRKREVDDDADVDNSKPKTQKGIKTIVSKRDVTAEEAAANGWVQQEIQIDDNFNTPGANFTGRKILVWTKPAA